MLKFTDFILQKEEVRTRVKYAPLPPKAIKKPPIERSNVSRVLEVLRQRISAFKNHLRAFQRNPNKKHNKRILGLYAGDTNQDLNVISESYDSFKIEKPTKMKEKNLNIK